MPNSRCILLFVQPRSGKLRRDWPSELVGEQVRQTAVAGELLRTLPKFKLSSQQRRTRQTPARPRPEAFPVHQLAGQGFAASAKPKSLAAASADACQSSADACQSTAASEHGHDWGTHEKPRMRLTPEHCDGDARSKPR